MPRARMAMLERWVRDLLGVFEDWLPVELVETLGDNAEWTLAVSAGLAAATALGVAWALWKRMRRTAGTLGRASGLVRHATGRNALRLAAEIRRGSRRLRRVLPRTVEDPAERSALQELLARFVDEELETALERMLSWVAIGGEIRVRELERAVNEELGRWSELPDGAERSSLEQSLARKKQQLALAQQTERDRARLLTGLEEAAAAIRTLEAELVALGDARTQALPGFREHMGEISEELRRQRDVHLEFPVRPGRS